MKPLQFLNILALRMSSIKQKMSSTTNISNNESESSVATLLSNRDLSPYCSSCSFPCLSVPTSTSKLHSHLHAYVARCDSLWMSKHIQLDTNACSLAPDILLNNFSISFESIVHKTRMCMVRKSAHWSAANPGKHKSVRHEALDLLMNSNAFQMTKYVLRIRARPLRTGRITCMGDSDSDCDDSMEMSKSSSPYLSTVHERHDQVELPVVFAVQAHVKLMNGEIVILDMKAPGALRGTLPAFEHGEDCPAFDEVDLDIDTKALLASMKKGAVKLVRQADELAMRKVSSPAESKIINHEGRG